LLSKIEPIVANPAVERIFLVRRYPLKGEKIISVSPPPFMRKSWLLSEIYRILSLFFILIFRKVDLLIGIYFYMHGFYADFFGRLFGKPVIQVIIGSDLERLSRSSKDIERLKRADFVAARGENTRFAIIKLGVAADKIFIPPNIFNFDITESPNINSEKRYDLIYTGNLVPVKRLDILLKAVKIVREKYGLDDISLAVVGDGELKDDLKRLAKDIDIDDNVEFVGFKADVFEYLRHARVFIMTSEYEGLPMSMLEALSCGLPCIMPDISDISTVAIDHHNALLTDALDIEQFADNIRKLLTDEELYRKLSENALKIADEKKDEYSPEHVADIWDRIFKRLFDGKTVVS